MLTIFMFAIIANLDNFIIGISYGVKSIRISVLSNIIIASLTFTATLLSMLVGRAIADIVPPQFANTLGCIVLISIGAYSIIKSLLKAHASNYLIQKNPEQHDTDHSGTIEAKESIALALSLALNNFALGIAISITGQNIIVTSTITFAFSIVGVWLGLWVGKRYLARFFSQNSEIVAGVIIIALGVIELFIG